MSMDRESERVAHAEWAKGRYREELGAIDQFHSESAWMARAMIAAARECALPEVRLLLASIEHHAGIGWDDWEEACTEIPKLAAAVRAKLDGKETKRG